jgi:hypothetical protein
MALAKSGPAAKCAPGAGRSNQIEMFEQLAMAHGLGPSFSTPACQLGHLFAGAQAKPARGLSLIYERVPGRRRRAPLVTAGDLGRRRRQLLDIDLGDGCGGAAPDLAVTCRPQLRPLPAPMGRPSCRWRRRRRRRWFRAQLPLFGPL